jgi:hypothetical protein
MFIAKETVAFLYQRSNSIHVWTRSVLTKGYWDSQLWVLVIKKISCERKEGRRGELQWTSDKRTSDLRTLPYRDTPKHVSAKVVLCYPRMLIRTLAYKDTKMLVPAVFLYPRFTVAHKCPWPLPGKTWPCFLLARLKGRRCSRCCSWPNAVKISNERKQQI